MPEPGTIIETVEWDGAEAGAVIRHLEPGDALALLAYINALSLERTFILFQGEQLTLAQEDAWLADRLAEAAHGDGVHLVVIAEGCVVGVAGAVRGALVQRHVASLGISVAPGSRDRGLGSRLFGVLLREAERHIAGLRLFQLDVFGNNSRARHLYRRHGFNDYARLPSGIRHGDDWVDFVSMYRPVGETSPGSSDRPGDDTLT